VASVGAGAALYIRAGRLLEGDGSAPVSGAAVLVEGGRIVAAGPASEVGAPPTEATVVEFPDGTVLPGLIDAHVHLTMRRGETSVEYVQRLSEAVALMRGVRASGEILAAGVTTVRDCGARGRVLQDLRDGINDGFIPGPRVLVSGPPITTTAGHLWALGYESDTAEEGRRAVRRLVKEDVDFIKVCATGGGMTPGSNVGRAQYSVEDLRAIADDAHRLGKHIAAHAHGTEGLSRAVDAGIDTIEHVSWLDATGRGQAFDETVAREMAARGTFANIASSPPRSLVEAAHPVAPDEAAGAGAMPTSGERPTIARWEHARRAMALGVPVCFSTDAVYGNWEDGHDLSYLAQALVEVGTFPVLDVLRMITAVPARAIGWGDRLGTVSEGKLADLLVVRGNPVENVRALHDVLAVYKEGVNVSENGGPARAVGTAWARPIGAARH
jgi:imidazolonepropionase-like amidohydrolase